jgi:hypothetical protein
MAATLIDREKPRTLRDTPTDTGGTTGDGGSSFSSSLSTEYTGPTEPWQVSSMADRPDVAGGNSFVTPEATVQSQLRTILEEGSPLMDLAESRSKAQAQSMGLLSSSMAVGAGQQALYDSAMPIATQDASTYAQFGLAQQAAEYQLGQTGYEGDITSALKTQEGLIQSGLQEQQGGIQGQLQAEQGGIQSKLQSEMGDINSRLQAEQGRINSLLQAEQGAIQMRLQDDSQLFEKSMTEYKASEEFKQLTTELANRLQISQEEAANRLEISNNTLANELKITDATLAAQVGVDMAKIDAANQQSYLETVGDLMYGYNQQLAAVMNDPNMSPELKTDMMNTLRLQVQDQVSMTSSIFGSTVDWDLPEIGGGSGGGGSSATNVTGTGADIVNTNTPGMITNTTYGGFPTSGGIDTWGWGGGDLPSQSPPPTTTAPPASGGSNTPPITDQSMKTVMNDSVLKTANTTTQFTNRFKQLYPNATSQQIAQAVDWWNQNWF